MYDTSITSEMLQWVDSLSADQMRDVLLHLATRSEEAARLLHLEKAWQEGNFGLLSDEVERVLKPRKRFYDYHQANQYAEDAHPTTLMLAQRADAARPELLKVIERAIILATRTIMRSDDSSGMQGVQIAGLLDAHATAARICGEAGELNLREQRRLVDWIFKYRYKGDQDFFDPDIVAYAPGLTQQAIERYRSNVENLENSTGAANYALVRLAVLDRDGEAIIALSGGREANELQIESMIELLDEANLPALAVMMAERGRNRLRSGLRWGGESPIVDRLEVEYFSHGQPERALQLRADRMREVGNRTTYEALKRVAKEMGRWDKMQEEAENQLERKQPSSFLQVLLDEERNQEAWEYWKKQPNMPPAQNHEVLDRRRLTHPEEVLQPYQELIRFALLPTEKKAYREAAALTKKLEDAATRAGRLPEFETFVQEILEENRRRPTCMQVFEKAGFVRE